MTASTQPCACYHSNQLLISPLVLGSSGLTKESLIDAFALKVTQILIVICKLLMFGFSYQDLCSLFFTELISSIVYIYILRINFIFFLKGSASSGVVHILFAPPVDIIIIYQLKRSTVSQRFKGQSCTDVHPWEEKKEPTSKVSDCEVLVLHVFFGGSEGELLSSARYVFVFCTKGLNHLRR